MAFSFDLQHLALALKFILDSVRM